jgi:hypothetical protein
VRVSPIPRRILRMVGWALLVCFILVFANATLKPKLPVKLVMPNGSIITRPFYIYPFWPLPSLYAKDGKTLLAKDIEFICFNDNFVKVSSYDNNYSGIYDAQGNFDLPNIDDFEEGRISGLSVKGKTCNGYYTGMIGPGMFFEGNEWPFLPPCEWRNFENLSLQDLSWFDRPCADKLPPRYYSSNPSAAR